MSTMQQNNEPSNATSDSTNRLPPLPPEAGSACAPRYKNYESQYCPLPQDAGPAAIVEALLKRPASLVHETMHGRSAAVAATVLLVAVLCLGAYGIVMGAFSGGMQYWAVPLKLTLGMLVSGLICLPSLYIFNSLDGGAQTLPQTAGLLLLFLALTALLLLGFAPIVWVFSQSTNALSFMGSLHLLFWLVAVALGLRLLKNAMDFLNQRRAGILRLWCFIFVVVALQMSTTLRPLIGQPDRLWTSKKQFFLAHWGDCLTRPERIR